MGHREDQMKIRHRQQLTLTRFNPFYLRQELTFRAMAIVARVIRVLPMLTAIAFKPMTAKDRSPTIGHVRNDFGRSFGKSL